MLNLSVVRMQVQIIKVKVFSYHIETVLWPDLSLLFISLGCT